MKEGEGDGEERGCPCCLLMLVLLPASFEAIFRRVVVVLVLWLVCVRSCFGHRPAHASARVGKLRRRRSLFSGAIRHLRLLFVNRQQKITPVHEVCWCMCDAGMNEWTDFQWFQNTTTKHCASGNSRAAARLVYRLVKNRSWQNAD